MRQRITLVHSPDAGIDPEALKLEKSGLRTPDLDAVREDRLTLALDELPPEVTQVLQDFRELHLSWTSPLAYETLEPFISRLSPGIHVSYSPDRSSDYEPSKLCALLHAFGPLGCMSQEAFTAAGESSFSFYQTLEGLHPIIEALSAEFCGADEACQSRVQQFDTAASLDFSFDGTAQVARLSVFWPRREQPVTIDALSNREIEVGIFSKGAPHTMGEYDIGLSGILAVFGDQKKPSAILFSFPSRHRISNARFSSRFNTPAGLHPTLQISLDDNQPPADDAGCLPYTYLTLPKAIFADKYQLDDDLFMASKNLTASRYTSLPVDLEAPAYTTKTWGSNVLLELAPPDPNEPQAWTVEVPLHLRYLEPSSTGERDVEVPYPVVFWACPADGDTDFANNPFDRTKLGYDRLFDSNTVFWQVTPQPVEGERIMNRIVAPVLKEEAASWIGLGTMVAVALGFAWVLWKLVRAYAQSGYGALAQEAQNVAKRKKAR